jgi:hypothetical protein
VSKRKTKVYGGVLRKVVSEATGVALDELAEMVMEETRRQMNLMIYDRSPGNKTLKKYTYKGMLTGSGSYIRTGDLFRSLTKTDLGNNRVRISLEVPYSLYVHEGTRRMPPRPFLKVAVQNAMRNFKKKAGLSGAQFADGSLSSIGGKKVEAYDYD